MLYSVENPIWIGKTIVTLRKMRGMPQEQLALDSDMSPAHLREIEHGRANFTLKTFSRIAATLDVPVGMFGVVLLEDGKILDRVHEVQAVLRVSKREPIGVGYGD